jgi:hypothetical protein
LEILYQQIIVTKGEEIYFIKFLPIVEMTPIGTSPKINESSKRMAMCNMAHCSSVIKKIKHSIEHSDDSLAASGSLLLQFFPSRAMSGDGIIHLLCSRANLVRLIYFIHFWCFCWHDSHS